MGFGVDNVAASAVIAAGAAHVSHDRIEVDVGESGLGLLVGEDPSVLARSEGTGLVGPKGQVPTRLSSEFGL